MFDDPASRFGALAGAIAIALFVLGALVVGDRPGSHAGAEEIAAFFAARSGRIQAGCVLFAASGPFLVVFLAMVASLARAGDAGARRAASVAYGCGLVFLALFLADVTSLAVGALRPGNMAVAPQLAVALRDLELLAMGAAAPVVSAMLGAFAVLALRHRVVWPRWVGGLAAIAGLVYTLRVATLTAAHGPFAADGVLGLWLPVIALAGWTVIASVVLFLDAGGAATTRRARTRRRSPG